MKLKLADFVNDQSLAALDALMSQDIKGPGTSRFTYSLGMVKVALGPHIEGFEAARFAAIKRNLVESDVPGKWESTSPEMAAALNREIADLVAAEVELPIAQIPLSSLPVDLATNGNGMAALRWLFKDE
jgi:hypothetical protein